MYLFIAKTNAKISLKSCIYLCDQSQVKLALGYKTLNLLKILTRKNFEWSKTGFNIHTNTVKQLKKSKKARDQSHGIGLFNHFFVVIILNKPQWNGPMSPFLPKHYRFIQLF